MEVPEIHFAGAEGVNIAWEQFGSGPDVLAIPGLISNMELSWEHEFYRRYLEYVSRHVRVTAFDKRGIGLSDKFFEAPTLEQRTTDILAVMDAAGLEHAAVLGVSEGGLIAQLFTAMHSERVDRLVLVNSNPGAAAMQELHRDADGSLVRLDRLMQKVQKLIETWGREPQYLVDWLTPSLSENVAWVRWMGRLQRQSATSADIARQFASLAPLDAASHLGEIDVPTLILHVEGDGIMPVAASRFLAERITGARLVEIPGSDHMAEVTPHWQPLTDAWLEFVTGARPDRRTERRVATVVFTDIVDSTARNAMSGDGPWSDLLESHDRLAWAVAEAHRGTIVKSTGDGLLARFDAPSEALEFSLDFRRALTQVDLRIRCGVHTGEIELRDNGDITGVAVNLAARVEHAADDGTIVVSSTVKDMLLGGDICFDDFGEHILKGFDRPWHLYTLTG
jgi:class 3 adenylate cyclase